MTAKGSESPVMVLRGLGCFDHNNIRGHLRHVGDIADTDPQELVAHTPPRGTPRPQGEPGGRKEIKGGGISGFGWGFFPRVLWHL